MSDTTRHIAPSLLENDPYAAIPGRDGPTWTAARSVPIGTARPDVPTGIPPDLGPEAGPAGIAPAMPLATAVFGPERKLVNRLVYVLANATGARCQWIDLRQRAERRAVPDAPELGWLSERELKVLDAATGLAPSRVPSDAAIDRLISAEESPELRARLVSFLALPTAVQCALAVLPSDESSRLLVITNSDRAPTEEPCAGIAPILDACRWAHCPVIVGLVGSEVPGFASFGRVLRVDGTKSPRGTSVRIRRVRADVPTHAGMTSNADELSLEATLLPTGALA